LSDSALALFTLKMIRRNFAIMLIFGLDWMRRASIVGSILVIGGKGGILYVLVGRYAVGCGRGDDWRVGGYFVRDGGCKMLSPEG
jgi:hypothetical protein